MLRCHAARGGQLFPQFLYLYAEHSTEKELKTDDQHSIITSAVSGCGGRRSARRVRRRRIGASRLVERAAERFADAAFGQPDRGRDMQKGPRRFGYAVFGELMGVHADGHGQDDRSKGWRFTFNDKTCSTKNIATIRGSGDKYVATWGTKSGSCSVIFTDKVKGKAVGTATLSIRNTA